MGSPNLKLIIDHTYFSIKTMLFNLFRSDYRTQVVRRGFKSSLLSTARGFGKRASLMDRGIIPTTAIGFGKRTLPLRGHDLNSQELSR